LHLRRATLRESKCIGPSTGAVEDAENLDRVANYAVRHNERRLRDHEFARARNSAGSSHFGVVRKLCLDAMNDVKRDALDGCRIVLFDLDPKRGEVIDCLWRPDWDHQRLGIGCSPRLPQDVIQSLICSCETPSPRERRSLA
jgi:hypothetical protein